MAREYCNIRYAKYCIIYKCSQTYHFWSLVKYPPIHSLMTQVAVKFKWYPSSHSLMKQFLFLWNPIFILWWCKLHLNILVMILFAVIHSCVWPVPWTQHKSRINGMLNTCLLTPTKVPCLRMPFRIITVVVTANKLHFHKCIFTIFIRKLI